VADDSILLGSNFVAGANKPDYHLKNVNYPRDFQVDLLLDIALAQPGQGCPRCRGKLLLAQGIEVGHVFKLGTMFSEALNAYFLDREGNQRPIIMGCYGIGIGRLLVAAIEQNHDDKGIIFPLPIAPYQVYLCALGVDTPEVLATAEKLYAELQKAHIEVLFDDRAESPGVKFNDADLLGIPWRLTVSPRTLKAQSAELKRRDQKESLSIPLEQVVDKVSEFLTSS
jgi:prolyl-tRNA synthetase